MPLVKHRCYHFNNAQHWRAGLVDQIAISDAELKTPERIGLVPFPGTNAVDNTAALAVDPCGGVYWVRKGSFEFVRALVDGSITVGHLGIDGDIWEPAGLAIGAKRIWVLVRSKTGDPITKVFRYFTDNLQRLAQIDIDRHILDLSGDGQDGVWLLLGNDDVSAELLHLDSAGVSLGRIALPAPLKHGRISTRKGADEIIVLDADSQTDPCLESVRWRIWRVDVCDSAVSAVFSLPRRDFVCNHDIPDFGPDLIAVDPIGRIHLLDGQSGVLWSLSESGEVLAQLPSVMPSHGLPIQSFVANEELLVSGPSGIGTLSPTESTDSTAPDSVPTYITPVLVSPDGVQRGWMRADLGVDFSVGTAIEISVASTRDQKLLEEIALLFTNKDLSVTTRLRRVNERLPWADDRTQVYQGSEWPHGRPLRFPLHEIDATHLWLRIRVYTTDGVRAPLLKSLQVLYPNISYAGYLPAVYQEDENSAKLLRRMLAIFESLFGDLDTQLGELPRRIDPRTAPIDWLPFLLRWLGLPAPTELSSQQQRRLLIHAPKLLRDRGTRIALEGLLRILVGDGNDFIVEDNGEGPVPWTLPDKRGGGYGPRLGCDTLVMVQKQPGFRLGCSATLGTQRLGHTRLDPMQLFARRSGKITIRVAASGADRERLEPLLRRYLPYFIPAHCRYTLYFVSQTGLRKPPRLDSEIRLYSDSPPRLAEDARIGRMRVTGDKSGGIILGRSTFSDDGPYLT